MNIGTQHNLRGGFVDFCVSIPMIDDKIYRAYLGTYQNFIPLSILVPNGQLLMCNKSISKTQLIAHNMYPNIPEIGFVEDKDVIPLMKSITYKTKDEILNTLLKSNKVTVKEINPNLHISCRFHNQEECPMIFMACICTINDNLIEYTTNDYEKL